MKDPASLVDELLARIRLAGRSGTLLLLIGEDWRAVEASRDALLALLRSLGPFQVEDLGKTSPRSGPVAWVEQTRARPADAFVLVVQPGGALAARAFGRRLNGERENLRGLAGPLLLFMCAEDERVLREVAPDFFTWIAQGYELPGAAELGAYARASGAGVEGAASSEPAAVAPLLVATPPIRYLHLSDIHFKTDATRAYDQDKVLRGLLTMLQRQRERSPLDLIFFTGDLAQGAEPLEYARAVAFFGDLLAATGVDPCHVFVVPGNHDVDRRVGRWVVRTLDSRETSDAFFVEENAASRAAHLRKFEAYRDALAPLLGASRPLGLHVGAEAVEVVEVRGAKIAVASFNSAWFAVAEDDIGKLWLGEANIDHAADRIAAEGPIAAAIALMHHPTEYLAEAERSEIERRLEGSFDLVLRGHLHKDKAKSIGTARGGYVEVASPAAYQGSQWPNGCFVGELQADPRTLRLEAYKFGSGADPWALDASAFPDDAEDHYRHTFALRARRAGGAVRRALGPDAANEIMREIDRRGRQEILRHAPGANQRQGTAPGSDTGEILRMLERRGGKLSPELRSNLAERLATTIPPPPDGTAPWGREAFGALLGRLVEHWSAHRDEWLENLGENRVTYALFALAFFERQAGQPVSADVPVGSAKADLLIGSESAHPEERAAIEIPASGRSEDGALIQLVRIMEAAHADLGAVLFFRPDGPRAVHGIEPHGPWLVYL